MEKGEEYPSSLTPSTSNPSISGNTVHGKGGNNPVNQGYIQASEGAIINFGEVRIVGNVSLGIEEYQVGNERKNSESRLGGGGAVQRQKDKATKVTDTTLSYIFQLLVDKVMSLLENRFGLLPGVENHLEKIEDSLVEIHDCVKIAEGSPIKDPKLIKLLEKLKDAAYDVEDLLDENEIAGRRRSEEAENMVVASVSSPNIMAENLKELSQRLEDIKAECDTFWLKETVTKFENKFKEQRETHSFVHKSQVIGRDSEKEEIVTLLLLPRPQVGEAVEDDESFSVIPIVGEGGVGKTTLAKSVFNDYAVQDHFQPKMWICVSDNLEPDNYNIKRLGNKILEHATDDRHNLSDLEKLQRRLRKELCGKRFLLVLDNVWNEIPDNWYRLRDLLLCGGRGSRIIVTTRSPKVASIMSKTQPHILKPLSQDVCWSLFCQRAFGNPTKEAVHPNLAPIGRRIVEKCKGNPLAVTTVGGLLQDERSESRWKLVRDSDMWSESRWKSVRDSEMWSLPEETETGRD